MNQSKDVITGSVVIALGILLFIATLGVKDFAAVGVGATFLPRISAGLFTFLGAVMVIGNVHISTKKKPASSPQAAPSHTGNMTAVFLSFVLMCAYVGLLNKLGFILTTSVYIFAQTLILTKGSARHYLQFAGLALLTASSTYFLFVRVFQVMVPAGILG